MTTAIKSPKLLLTSALALLLASPALSAPAERVDLSTLADGERREFASAERTVVAQRTGDNVHITLSGPESENRSFDCNVQSDRCIIMTMDDSEGAGKLKMMFMRHGDGTENHDVIVTGPDAGEGGRRVVVMRNAHGEDEGETVIEKEIHIVGDGEGSEVVFHGDGEDAALWVQAGGEPFAFETSGSGGEHMAIVRLGDDGKVLLGCPEGDAHLRVDKTEADVAYTCPKHGVRMTKVEPQRRIRREVKAETK